MGIGIEGDNGRFKPDVVAPGTFVVSTRSGEWDTGTYFYQNPTNIDTNIPIRGSCRPGCAVGRPFPIVPNNAIGVNITVTANADSPAPFPRSADIFRSDGRANYPGSVFTTNNQVNIPSDGGLSIADILNSETLFGFNYGVSNVTSQPISFDVTTTITTTNAWGTACWC